MKVELDTQKQLSGRMFFLREEHHIIQADLLLTKEVQKCNNYTVYLIVSSHFLIPILDLTSISKKIW